MSWTTVGWRQVCSLGNRTQPRARVRGVEGIDTSAKLEDTYESKFPDAAPSAESETVVHAEAYLGTCGFSNRRSEPGLVESKPGLRIFETCRTLRQRFILYCVISYREMSKHRQKQQDSLV